jgi:O-antigen/teichoic acid export membrane protein
MYVLFRAFDIGAAGHWFHMIALSFIIILHSLHMVFILAKERIKAYNYLNFFQPALLLLALVVVIFVFNERRAVSYIIALYISFLIAIVISSSQLIGILKVERGGQSDFRPKTIIEKGFYNQLANLCHILSNRYNFYLLGNTILVGIYSSATSLIESVWIISGSVSPIILTFIANDRDPANNGRITLLLAKICFLLSFLCIVVLYFIPKDFFVFILGEDFIHVKTVMLYLSPGILCISFATIISHYFAGLGKQRILLIANSAGLLTTISTSYFLISRDQLLGACYAACLSYFVASLILVIYFMKENGFRFLDLFKFSGDINLIRDAK